MGLSVRHVVVYRILVLLDLEIGVFKRYQRWKICVRRILKFELVVSHWLYVLNCEGRIRRSDSRNELLKQNILKRVLEQK